MTAVLLVLVVVMVQGWGDRVTVMRSGHRLMGIMS